MMDEHTPITPEILLANGFKQPDKRPMYRLQIPSKEECDMDWYLTWLEKRKEYPINPHAPFGKVLEVYIEHVDELQQAFMLFKTNINITMQNDNAEL